MQGSGIVEWKRYVAGAVYTVRTTTSQSGGSTSYAIQRTDKSYLYNDHLGSLDVVVDHVGNITHSASFDAWGQRRHAEDWNGAFSASSLALANYSQPVTQRGFTSHEMLDDVGLIHMNGRIFDPRLARFMQADPYIQAATHSQSYNRYSYTFNNPLNATDPSGYIAWGPILWAVGSYAAADYGRRNNIPWLGQVASIVGCAYGYCSAAAFGSSYGTTQNLGVAIIAGISASAMSGMDPAAAFLMGGMLGGTSSMMMGGEYGHGFISAGLGSLGGMAGGDGFSYGGMIVSAVVGGTISEMTGGKFKNGAATAAFSYALAAGARKYGPGGDWQNLESKEDPGKIAHGEERDLFGGRIKVSKENVGDAAGVVSDAELAQVESHYNTIFADSEGGKILSDLSTSAPLKVILNERGVHSARVIKVTTKVPGWWIFNDKTSHKGGLMLTVDVRPGSAGSFKNYYPGASGKVPFSPVHVLLHETGHAVYGYLDVNKGPTSIIQYADPILGRIEGTNRRTYGNAF